PSRAHPHPAALMRPARAHRRGVVQPVRRHNRGMSSEREWRLLRSVRRAIRTDPSRVALTEAYPVLGETVIVKILDLALRIGESMFAVGASAHDATFAITRVAQTYGLHGVQVDVTFNAISVSYHRGEEDWPTTLMRVVRVAS